MPIIGGMRLLWPRKLNGEELSGSGGGKTQGMGLSPTDRLLAMADVLSHPSGILPVCLFAALYFQPELSSLINLPDLCTSSSPCTLVPASSVFFIAPTAIYPIDALL